MVIYASEYVHLMWTESPINTNYDMIKLPVLEFIMVWADSPDMLDSNHI